MIVKVIKIHRLNKLCKHCQPTLQHGALIYIIAQMEFLNKYIFNILEINIRNKEYFFLGSKVVIFLNTYSL